MLTHYPRKYVAFITQTPAGRRAISMAAEDAKKLHADGRAIRHHNGLYEAIEQAAPANESDDDSSDDLEQSGEPEKRRVGRPPKNRG